MPPLPPVTQFLMLACTAMFCLQIVAPSLTVWLVLFPVFSGAFWPWQPLTYAFLHLDFLHLFFNMLGLWMFGSQLEVLWGRQRYLAFLAMGAVFGSLTYMLLTTLMGVAAPLVGFSGAVYATLMAAGMLFPNQTVMLVIPPIPMKMRTMVIVFGVLAAVLGRFGRDYGSLAHLGGMLGGWLTIRFWRGQPPFGKGGGGPRRLH